MANPQKENGHTGIANELLEKIYQSNFSQREIRIILVVIRYTYGFSRKSANLSLTFLAEATGIKFRHIQTTLSNLILKKVLIVKSETKGTKPREIEFNKNYDNWLFTIDRTGQYYSKLPLTEPVNRALTEPVNTKHGPNRSTKKDINKENFKANMRGINIPPELDTEDFKKAWSEWIQYRKEIRKKLTPTSIKHQLNFLLRQPQATECIYQSIRNRWIGLFEIKNNGKDNSNGTYRKKKSRGDDFDNIREELESLQKQNNSPQLVGPGIGTAVLSN